jgi:uncharacterized lipoprotein YmbA
MASILLPLLLGGCGSKPMKVFDLSPSRAGPLIYVDKPSLAGYFDRRQMVTRRQ